MVDFIICFFIVLVVVFLFSHLFFSVAAMSLLRSSAFCLYKSGLLVDLLRRLFRPIFYFSSFACDLAWSPVSFCSLWFSFVFLFVDRWLPMMMLVFEGLRSGFVGFFETWFNFYLGVVIFLSTLFSIPVLDLAIWQKRLLKLLLSSSRIWRLSPSLSISSLQSVHGREFVSGCGLSVPPRLVSLRRSSI